MKDLDFTLLELKDIEGENKLNIFDNYGTKAAITDFAILLGGDVSSVNFTKEGIDLKNRTGYYFNKTDASDNDVSIVNDRGNSSCESATIRIFGARPVLSYSLIINESLNGRINNQGVYEVEYGEYPQTIVGGSLSYELENLYIKSELQKTGKEYTTDSVDYNKLNIPFKVRKHIEYEYNGEKYIRILGDFNSVGEMLSDGRIVEEGETYFVKVEPIVWLIDKERDISVTKKLLFSGIQFDNKEKYLGKFNSTNMCYFLKNYFRKDIISFKIEKPKLYLVNFSDEIEKYYPAYEVEDILREFYTNIELIPEDANFFKEDALKYHSKIGVSALEYYLYVKNRIKIDTKEYLDYLFELSVLGDNEEIYNSYEKYFMEKQVYDFVNEQAIKLIMK